MPRERFAVSENAAHYKNQSVVFLHAFPFTGPKGIRLVTARSYCHRGSGRVDGIRMGAPLAGHPVRCDKVGHAESRGVSPPQAGQRFVPTTARGTPRSAPCVWIWDQGHRGGSGRAGRRPCPRTKRLANNSCVDTREN